MDRYAVVDPSGKVVNVIVWDGQAQWAPPEGHKLQKHEECYVGDVWHPELNEFVRPLSLLKPPEGVESLAQRKAMYEDSKAKLKSTMLFLNHQGVPEV